MIGTLTLVLETSTPHGSLALIQPDGQLEQREFSSDRSHNAVLFLPLKELLDGRGEKAIGRVIVGSGPGSYSGTRVGIAAGQGVAIASGCPAVAMPSILAVPAAQAGAACLAIGDARRGSYWTARVEHSKLTAAPELTDAAGLAERMHQSLEQGAAVFSFEDPARFPLATGLLAQVSQEFPSASRLWLAWLAAEDETRAAWSEAAPQPMYLKPPHITPAKHAWRVQP